jgi:diguanylate cyclase (GGDEF)-like protein/PAS domain S-box-containing protein
MKDKAKDIKDTYQEHRILVADDEESIRTFIKRLIGVRVNCHQDYVADGDALLAMLDEHTYDVVVTDMVMPGLHGVELIKAIRAKAPSVDILVLTGYPMEFPYVRVVQEGANDFITKPFPSEELEAKLIRLFDARRLRHAHMIAQRKYRSLFELSSEGMLFFENDEHTIMDVNQAFLDLTGRDREAVCGNNLAELLNANDYSRFQQWLTICRQSGKGTMGDLPLQHANGNNLFLDATVTFVPVDDEEVLFCSFRDVTEKREIEEQLASAAQRDELTGLFNKRSFGNRLNWAVSLASKGDKKLVLLMLDLDNFKQCNDVHGHQVGDALLAAFGDIIQHSIRGAVLDEGFRFGGDEFAVILPNTDKGGSRVVVGRIQAAFEKVERFGTSVSIGSACFEEGISAEGLLRRADQALYQAKAEGKNTACFL